MIELEQYRPVKLSDLPHKLDGLIGYDLETDDVGIRAKQGPGWAWRDGGKVVGFAIAADNFVGYLPINHEAGGNLDPAKVIEIVTHWMSNPHQAKVGANIIYDLGWSKRAGISIMGPCYDIQWAEALLNEHRSLYTPYNYPGYPWGPDENHLSYTLDSLAKSYLGQGKNESLLRQAAEERDLDPKAELWKLPAHLVGPYAISDAVLTRAVFLQQAEKLKEKDLWKLFEMECSLLPLYLDMRWRGVRVDTDAAEQLKARWTKEVAEFVAQIKHKTGIDVNLNASASLAKVLKTQGIKCPLSPKTQKASVTKPWLETLDDPLVKIILQAKSLNKLAGTFVDGQILGNAHDGRLHTEFHPLREDSEDGVGSGTISGRLSSSHPNLQQVPKRSEQGLLLRGCFLPEEGEEWGSADISQQEPRLTIHYSAITTRNGQPLAGAMEAVEKYIRNPKISYHTMVSEQTGLDYDSAKILNLGLTYGMGSVKVAGKLKVPVEKAKEFIAQYHERLPFVNALKEVLRDKVNQKGEIKTLLGRICRFPMYEPRDYEESKKGEPLPFAMACSKWGQHNIRRAWAHKELNALIQGSAADQVKKAMADIQAAGLGKYLALQIHDELCSTNASRKIMREIADLMEKAVVLKVPVVVETKFGPSWGTVKS